MGASLITAVGSRRATDVPFSPLPPCIGRWVEGRRGSKGGGGVDTRTACCSPKRSEASVWFHSCPQAFDALPPQGPARFACLEVRDTEAGSHVRSGSFDSTVGDRLTSAAPRQRPKHSQGQAPQLGVGSSSPGNRGYIPGVRVVQL